MISSVGVEAGNCLLTRNALQTQILPTHKRRLKLKPKAFTISSTLTQESSSISNDKKKLGVVVKPMEKSRLVLKFIWMEKNIGIAIDQVIPGGRGTIPVSPYYFWPQKDAWEELKAMMDTKHWISYKQMVLLLNQASDIINLWQHHHN